MSAKSISKSTSSGLRRSVFYAPFTYTDYSFDPSVHGIAGEAAVDLADAHQGVVMPQDLLVSREVH